MHFSEDEFSSIRSGIAAIPADVSNDAVGSYAPKPDDIYAPETHAAAIDPATPIVVGARGAGKSFWSGVLGQQTTRQDAAKAYPKLGLEHIAVYFGFTGVGGPEGVAADALDANVPASAGGENAGKMAKAFWWATILRAAARDAGEVPPRLADLVQKALNWEEREELLLRNERRLNAEGKQLLVVYDALDMVATSWPRRRLLTEALLDVLWAMRAYRAIRLKLFLRPDQIDDDALRFVELPKLRAGAVRLTWSDTDLYGLLYARLALAQDERAKQSFRKLLRLQHVDEVSRDAILARKWSLSHSIREQVLVMDALAGPYMAAGQYGFKKGRTYDWPLTHLADAFDEVTPRSFLGLMIAAAKHGVTPTDRVITPEGIRHGLRAASKTRVDQLHQEFPWIKGVLAPLAGLLLPQEQKVVFQAWRRAKTVQLLLADAEEKRYLPPFSGESRNEASLAEAMMRIGVIFRRKDDRLDMPDLFRVAAKLLKKGATAPL
jgi:hypothetical protein